jgi:hypothetical protein
MKTSKLVTLLSFLLLSPLMIWAQQDTDHKYQKTLKDVLEEIQTRFHVKIKYSEPQVKDKVVTYADWRFRTTVDETLANVLAPLDMKVNKEGPTTLN